MKYYKIKENQDFVGRKYEQQRLDQIYSKKKEAKLIVVYGRRRIGKTELIEQYFRNHKIWKFEGIQVSQDDKRTEEEIKVFQIQMCLKQLSKYLDNKTLEKIKITSWIDFFEEIDPIARSKEVVLYFEELQWMTNYKNDFFAELKPFWDSYWRKNKGLTIVFCGSSTSFFTQNLLFDQALYSRDQEEFHIKEFNLVESADFLKNKGTKEVFLANLILGGIPAYLKRISGRGTVLSKICENSFTQDSFYSKEYEKIFVSRMSEYKYYRKVLEFLVMTSSASSLDIYQAVTKTKNLKISGKFLEILNDLSDCGFIKSYLPLTKNIDSKLTRYRIADEYIHFYYKFIHPIKDKIDNGFYNDNPIRAINRQRFDVAMGFSFERWCLKNQKTIAKILQIDKLHYHSGSFFCRKSFNNTQGFQIDLMFIVENVKIIFCEIKYYQGSVSKQVAHKLDRQIQFFIDENPKYKKATIEKVLIATEGASVAVEESFDFVITLSDLFNSQYW